MWSSSEPMHTLAEWVVRLVLLYALVGVIFGIAFVLRGVNRIDPVAPESTWGFRLVILPGVVALWPLLARRWLRGSGPPEERNAHRLAARRRTQP